MEVGIREFKALFNLKAVTIIAPVKFFNINIAVTLTTLTAIFFFL